jgi:hypothetical protein
MEEQLKRKGLQMISPEEALKMAKEVNAAALVECSALT